MIISPEPVEGCHPELVEGLLIEVMKMMLPTTVFHGIVPCVAHFDCSNTDEQTQFLTFEECL
jgi:hypothetical protein